MSTRLIYLLEEDFQHDLANILNQEDLKGKNVVFFVELRKVDDQLIPMIDGLPKLRLRKAEDRIKKWIRKNIKGLESFSVLVFDDRPSRSNPDYNFLELPENDFHVLVPPHNEIRLAPYLKHNAGIHQIKHLSLGDFTDEGINGF